MKVNFLKEWCLPHQTMPSPNKSGNVRGVCNADAKHKELCIHDTKLVAHDLLQGLIGTISRFSEEPVALTADNVSMCSIASF